MAGFFGFGPFSTPVGQLIEKATDNSASAGNLPLHLQICDSVEGSDSGPKDAVAALKKRFTSNTKNFHIINLSLTVLETCVKNCGLRFHIKIAQREFLNDMLKVVNPKNNPPTIVRERVLGLIQYWADAFKGRPDLSAVEELYEQMKSSGIEFPPIDLDSLAPIETTSSTRIQLSQPSSEQPLQHQQHQSSSRSQGQRSSPRPHRGRGPMGPLAAEQVAKLLNELEIVRKNMDLMSEIMNENEPGKENSDDMQLLDEINRVVHEMQLRVAGLIERCQDEIILESTLVMNDDLNTLFVRYDRWLKNCEAARGKNPPSSSATTVETVGGQQFTGSGTTESNISYPSFSNSTQPPPPSYEATPTSQQPANGGGIGQLIDLGSDITAPPPPTSTSQMVDPTSDDLTAEFAQLGITTTTTAPVSTATTNGVQQQSVQGGQEQALDEFDMFAQSRTAYGTHQGSTYDDNMIQQDASLSAAVRGKGQDQQAPPPTANPYGDLSQWLGQTDLQQQQQQQQQQPPPQQQQQQQPESATSAEFDQFLAQRASKGESLPAERPRPQMQKMEDQSDELFAL